MKSVANINDEWTDWQDEVFEDPSSHTFVSGGLGCGKTNLVPKCGVAMAMKYPGSKGFIAADTFDQVMKSIDYELVKRLRHLKLRYTPGSKEKPYRLSNGSEIWYESYQKQPADYKGPQWDWGIFDEADNKDCTREKYEMLDGRIGRDRASKVPPRLIAFMNPVSHGHWAYQDARELALPGFRLFEISTYQNRRFLREGYIEKQEARRPPGTPGHDRFVLGQCGIPHPLAVYKHFKYKRDRYDADSLNLQVEDNGYRIPGVAFYRSAMHLHDGQPVGWLRVAIMEDGRKIPVRGKLFHGQSPAYIADAVREIMARTPNEPEPKPVLADPGHEMYKLLRRAGLRLSRARTDISTGMGLVRNEISTGNLKLLRLPDKRCATTDLLIDLEEHKFSDKGELEEEQWSQARPLEYICAAHRIQSKGRRDALHSLGQSFNRTTRGSSVGVFSFDS